MWLVEVMIWGCICTLIFLAFVVFAWFFTYNPFFGVIDEKLKEYSEKNSVEIKDPPNVNCIYHIRPIRPGDKIIGHIRYKIYNPFKHQPRDDFERFFQKIWRQSDFEKTTKSLLKRKRELLDVSEYYDNENSPYVHLKELIEAGRIDEIKIGRCHIGITGFGKWYLIPYIQVSKYDVRLPWYRDDFYSLPYLLIATYNDTPRYGRLKEFIKKQGGINWKPTLIELMM